MRIDADLVRRLGLWVVCVQLHARWVHPSMSDWQPIETAPKDGSWVLLGGGQHDANTWYGPGPEAPAVVGRWDKGWFFANWDGDYRSEYLIPTHWMPLPVPRSG